MSRARPHSDPDSPQVLVWLLAAALVLVLGLAFAAAFSGDGAATPETASAPVATSGD